MFTSDNSSIAQAKTLIIILQKLLLIKKAYKDTVMNQTCHTVNVGLLKIKLTVPFRILPQVLLDVAKKPFFTGFGTFIGPASIIVFRDLLSSCLLTMDIL